MRITRAHRVLNTQPGPWCRCSGNSCTCYGFDGHAAGGLLLVPGLELQGKWRTRAGTAAGFSAPVASVPNEQMALSGAWRTESLPGWLWLASPRAAVLFPDPGFQAGWLGRAGWAGAWAADRASRGLGGQLQPCSLGVEQRAKSSLNPFCSCGNGCSSRP